jgi:predicted kinase
MARHLVHLICGSTGAGATTYARELSERIDGVVLSLDEWMSRLYWVDAPNPLETDWACNRMVRCLDQMWSIIEQVAAQGIPCVLDIGCGQVDTRQRFYRAAADEGLSVQLHFLDVPAAERWRRIEVRNRETGTANNLPFAVTRDVFDANERLWEVPSELEIRARNGVRVTE